MEGVEKNLLTKITQLALAIRPDQTLRTAAASVVHRSNLGRARSVVVSCVRRWSLVWRRRLEAVRRTIYQIRFAIQCDQFTTCHAMARIIIFFHDPLAAHENIAPHPLWPLRPTWAAAGSDRLACLFLYYNYVCVCIRRLCVWYIRIGRRAGPWYGISGAHFKINNNNNIMFVYILFYFCIVMKMHLKRSIGGARLAKMVTIYLVSWPTTTFTYCMQRSNVIDPAAPRRETIFCVTFFRFVVFRLSAHN